MTPVELNAIQATLKMQSKDLAVRLGVTPETFSRWRNGRLPIPIDLGERLARIAPSTTITAFGRPKKATYTKQITDGRYVFYFTVAGQPLSFEDKLAMSPGTTFWRASSPVAEYDGSTQSEYKRSTIPGHRNHSHPTGNERVPDDI